MRRAKWVVWLCCCSAGLATAQDEVEDRAIVRLPPSAFTQLPLPVRIEAEKRGCTVPQNSYDPDRGKNNVITGSFRGAGVETWALLCSRNRVSAILVCNARAPLRCEELAPSEDIDRLQYLGLQGFAYSRLLTRIPRGEVRDGVTLARDGVDDYFEGKASVIWYWESGRWRRLAGVD